MDYHECFYSCIAIHLFLSCPHERQIVFLSTHFQEYSMFLFIEWKNQIHMFVNTSHRISWNLALYIPMNPMFLLVTNGIRHKNVICLIKSVFNVPL